VAILFFFVSICVDFVYLLVTAHYCVPPHCTDLSSIANIIIILFYYYYCCIICYHVMVK